jgi:hypothetical protein
MQLPTTLQGRPFGPEQLAQVQALVGQNGDWSRYRLSRELARLWDWRTPQGQLKDMAARTLLLKMQAQGWIELPPRRMPSPTRSGRPPLGGGPSLEPSPVEGSLQPLLPLRLEEVSQANRTQARRQLEAAVHQYHYLGYRSRVGQNLQYWVCDRQDRPVACVVFGAPAWQCAVRDQWIGWSAAERARRLGGVVNNTRFLIFAWVRVPHLASHILSQVSRRIRRDCMDNRSGCWKPSWTGSALPAPATAPPIGFAWARPRAGDAKARRAGSPPPSRTSMSGRCTETSVVI